MEALHLLLQNETGALSALRLELYMPLGEDPDTLGSMVSSAVALSECSAPTRDESVVVVNEGPAHSEHGQCEAIREPPLAHWRHATASRHHRG